MIEKKPRLFTMTDAILILLYTAVEIYSLYVVGSLYDQFKGLKPKEKVKDDYIDDYPIEIENFV